MERLGRGMLQSAIDDNDAVIRKALVAAEIPIKYKERVGFRDHVSCTVYGQLGHFRFERDPVLWKITGGLMPLEVAREMRESVICETVVWSEPTSGRQHVDSFSITEDAGLRLIADTIRKHGLA